MCALAGCASRDPIALSPAWPDTGGDYERVTDAWTRRGLLREPFQQVLEVYATFKSPAWRVAYIDRAARREGLSDSARHARVEQAKKQAAERYEFTLLVTTYDFRENDLQKGERSVWRLLLVDAQGNAVAPAKITIDRRARDVIRAEFPQMGDFARAYTVTFPRDIDVLADGAQQFSLRMASSRGGVELVWRAP
jgi:hypothetical protein